MGKIQTFYVPLVLCIVLAKTDHSYGQALNFDNKAIEQDFLYNLDLYTSNYIGAELDAFGLNQLSAWQSSGKTLNPFAFSIGLQAAATFLPSAQTKFNFNQVGFTNNLRLEDPNDPYLPTLLGGASDKKLVYKVTETTTGISYESAFPALPGINSPGNAIASSALTAGIGLPYQLEVDLRFFPNINEQGLSHYELGGGIKHTISRYFIEEQSPFNIGLGAYYNYSTYVYQPPDFLDGSGQEILLRDYAFSTELIGSYDRKFYALFLAIGYYQTRSTFDIHGTYTFEVTENDPVLQTPIVYEAFRVEDPVSVQVRNSNVRFMAGASVKLAHLFELGVSYSVAEYQTASLILKFNFNNKPL